MHSWCQLSDIPNHEIYTTETLKVLLDELTKQFPEINLNVNDLSLFRQFIKYILPGKNSNSIESIYAKKLEFKQKLQLRNKVQFEINKQNEQSPLIPSKTFNEIQNSLLPIVNKEIVADNTEENIDIKKIMNLIAALKNLYDMPDITIKCKIEQLLKNVTNYLFVHILDMNCLKSYNHIFYEEHCK